MFSLLSSLDSKGRAALLFGVRTCHVAQRIALQRFSLWDVGLNPKSYFVSWFVFHCRSLSWVCYLDFVVVYLRRAGLLALQQLVGWEVCSLKCTNSLVFVFGVVHHLEGLSTKTVPIFFPPPVYLTHRCQPSRNRAGNPAFWCISRIPAFFPERPAFLALFWERNFLTNCDNFWREKEILWVMEVSQSRIFVCTTKLVRRRVERTFASRWHCPKRHMRRRPSIFADTKWYYAGYSWRRISEECLRDPLGGTHEVVDDGSLFDNNSNYSVTDSV